MSARVIQGFFLTGAPRVAVPYGPVLQRRVIPGPPPPVHAPGAVAQRFGAASLAVDPARLRLESGRGVPLPAILLAKMEAAFGADFFTVRVHVGPQASQILPPATTCISPRGSFGPKRSVDSN